MDILGMFIIAFCSVGIITCLVYILYQLQKEKMENYAKQRIYEEMQKVADKQVFRYSSDMREPKKTKSGKSKKGSC